jgi:hypothetical protein
MPRFTLPVVGLALVVVLAGCRPAAAPAASPAPPTAASSSATPVASLGGASAAPSSLPCSSVESASPPAVDGLVAAIPLGCEGGAIAVGGGSVWVVPHLERVMLQIDPETNEVVERIPLGDRGPGAEIAANDEMVWASVSSPSYDLERLVRVDPSSAGVVASVDVEAGFPRIAGESVWAGGPAGLHRVETDTNELGRTLAIPECGVVTDGEQAWCVGDQSAFELPAEAGEPRQVAEGVTLGVPVAWAAGRIWGISSDGLWGLDPATGQVLGPLEPPQEVGTWLLDAVVLGETLWFAASSVPGDPFSTAADRLVAFDPVTQSVDCVVEVPPLEHGMAVGEGSIWLPLIREPWVLRIEPTC